MAEIGQTAGVYREPDTSEETLLLNRLKRVEANPAGVYAVHLHLSRLRASNRQPHFIGIASRTFDGLIENYEATVFPLHNADIVVLCRNVPVDDADAAVDRVRSLFGEDPLLASSDEFEDDFSTWYDLSQPEDFSAFARVANELAVESQRRRQKDAQDRAQADRDRGEPLSGLNLATINQTLQATRVADIIREQTCLQMTPKGPGDVVFREYFVNIADLKKRIAPGVNLFASPWLFQFLTETLDKRMLAVLGNRDFNAMPSPISINLNVGTILSRDFQKFHQSVGKSANKVTIEMQVIDIFADMNTYGYARDSLQERGYRVCVDGLNPQALHFFDPGTLKSDYVKIAWGPEFEGDSDAGRLAEMRDVVQSTGKDGVILARVDTEEAVKWGISLGISRFQGYFIDDLMKKVGYAQLERARAEAKKAAAAPPPKAPAPAAAQAQPRPQQPQAQPQAQPRPAQPQAQPQQPRPAQPQAQPRPAQPQPQAQPQQPRPAQPQAQPHPAQAPAQPQQPRPAQPPQAHPQAQPQPQPQPQPHPQAPQPQPQAQPRPAQPQAQPQAQPRPAQPQTPAQPPRPGGGTTGR